MNPTPKRQAVKSFLTPDIRDFVLQQIEKVETKVFPKVGSKHPDKEKYPDHRFSHAEVAEEQGLLYTFFYVAPRLDQEGYNWEYAVADIGGTKFDAISAVYATPRTTFTPDLPLMGTAAPVFSGSTTPEGYVLAQRRQSRVNDRELDGHLVFETRVYVRKVSISEVSLNDATGRPKRSSTELFFLGEDVDGTPIEELVEDLSGDYWGQQENGEYRELRQLSANWFAVETSNVLPEDSENSALNPAKTRKIERVTPTGTDIVFRETGSMPDPIPSYGDDHYLPSEYPDHVLSFIEPADASGLLFDFYYVAERDDQEDYNWEHSQADLNGVKFPTVSREYVILRSSFTPDTPAEGSTMEDLPVNLFTGTYVLSGKRQTRIGDPKIGNLFVVEKRTYIKKSVLTDIGYDQPTGRSTAGSVTQYYRGELISGTAIETLVADTDNAYWGLQTDGTTRKSRQESTNWFTVTEENVLPESPENSASNPAKTDVVKRVTPLDTDVIFSEIGSMPSTEPEYGDDHYNAARWPDHKLGLIEPVGPSGLLFKFKALSVFNFSIFLSLVCSDKK